jgi:hypothetical protein
VVDRRTTEFAASTALRDSLLRGATFNPTAVLADLPALAARVCPSSPRRATCRRSWSTAQ